MPYSVITTNTAEWDVPGDLPTLKEVKFVNGEGASATEEATITVNVTGSGDARTVQAKAYSAKTPNPTNITGNVTWSVTPPEGGKGVTIDANTGLISVDPKAMNGSYTITATSVDGKSQGGAKSATLTVTRATAELTTIELDKQRVQVDGTKGDTITITPKDQFGDVMNGSFTWTVTPSDSNISVTGNTITVGAKAAENTSYTVKSSTETPTATFSVSRAQAAAKEITISGGSTELIVPADGVADAKSTAFGAAVKDQYGGTFNGTVDWSVTPANEGVSIGTDGIVTVTNAAKAAVQDTTGKTYTVTATCGSAKATSSITVKRDTQKATSIKIFKDGAEVGANDTAVIPPTETSADKTYTYRGKLYDQYGAEMSGSITLSATGTVENAEFTPNTGVLTVKHTVAKDSTLTIKAASGSIEKSVTVKFVDIDVPWTGVKANENLIYGVTNQQAVTYPASGEASVGEGTKLAGTYSVEAPTVIQGAGSQTVNVVFTVTAAGEYNGTKITNPVTVSIAKKPITATVKPVSVEYKADIPTSFDFDVTGLVGQDGKEDLGLTLTTAATSNSDAGSYAVTKSTCTSVNYDVTVAENTALTITPAEIDGVQITPSISDVTILANDVNNKSIDTLKTKLGLPTEVTVNFGDSKTENLPATWTTTTAFNKKGAEYTFVGKPTLTGNFKATNYDVPVKITVTPVTGTASITPTASTKAFAAVTADSASWATLGMPAQVTVSYDNSVADGPYNITDWSPNLASLKAQATGTADKSVKLTPVVTYPEWATITNTPEFTMTLTPKYPVTVTVVAPSDITFGGTLAAPTASQTAIENGTDDTADVSYTYTYTGVDGTTYGPSTEAPKNAGKYQVVATLNSLTHSGTSEPATFTISQKDISSATVTLDLPEGGYTYDKTAKTPAATVKDGETVLVAGTDYTVEYTNNTNAGTATVTATGKGNYSGTATASFTIAKASIADMVPTVAGTGEAGTVLTASLEGVAPEELTWEWYVGNSKQSETTAAYVVKPADSNKEITAKAVAKETNYTGTTTASSSAITVPKVTITGTVTITASVNPIATDTVLTANASVVPSVAVTYQWNKNGTPIADATSSTYTVAAEDADASITVTVTPGEDFDGTLTSAPVVVGKSVLTGMVTVTASGTPTVGDTLTAAVSASPAVDTDYTITWLRDGVDTGVAGMTYTVAADDLGKTITAKVTATGDSYTGELVSAGTSIPATAPDAPSVTATAGDAQVTVTWTTPAANGAPVTGYTVTASSTTAAVAGGGSVTLPVGTNTYTFTGLTNGTEYSFGVTATNSIGNSAAGTATATPAAPVTPVDPEPEVPPYIPPVFVDPGAGSGSGTGTGTTTPDKDVTENPDGSTVTVETQPDGTVVTTTVDPEGNTTTKLENPDGSSTTTIQNVDGTTALVNTDASGKTSAVVDLSNEAVSSAQNTGAAVALPIENVTATRDTETAPTVVVNTESEQPVKVEIPVSNAGTGTVAVLVKADGTEEIIKTTVPTAGGIAVKLNSGDAVKVVDNSKFFADTATHWGGDAVDFVSARELFGGTGENKFSPDDAMTRGMLMTVLARYENVDTTGGATWYEKGVAWAVAQGLSDGTNPNGGITREQLATIIYRYAQSKGVDTTASGNLERFPDAGKVSDWAREAMSWAVGEGIISGVGGVTLDPSGNATRAQVATIIMRYAERFAE